jgi:hypothetical protein
LLHTGVSILISFYRRGLGRANPLSHGIECCRVLHAGWVGCYTRPGRGGDSHTLARDLSMTQEEFSCAFRGSSMKRASRSGAEATRTGAREHRGGARALHARDAPRRSARVPACCVSARARARARSRRTRAIARASAARTSGASHCTTERRSLRSYRAGRAADRLRRRGPSSLRCTAPAQGPPKARWCRPVEGRSRPRTAQRRHARLRSIQRTKSALVLSGQAWRGSAREAAARVDDGYLCRPGVGGCEQRKRCP